jgi:hypothetical protein
MTRIISLPTKLRLFTLLLTIGLCLLGATCGCGSDNPGKLPQEVLAAKTIGLYFEKDDEMARRWLERFLVQPQIAARFTYLPEYEKADIVLVLARDDKFSTVGIPDSASTISMPDGSVTGVDCVSGSNGKVDCSVYEGRSVQDVHWLLRVYPGRDFGKNWSPPGIDLPPPPGIESKEPILNPSAKSVLTIDREQAQVKPCVEGRSIIRTDEDGITTGCEVVEFWNQLQKAENKPELASIPGAFNRWGNQASSASQAKQ